MKRVTIKIETTNAAFDYLPEYEVERILKVMAERIKSGQLQGNINDLNGNSCGQFKVTK